MFCFCSRGKRGGFSINGVGLSGWFFFFKEWIKQNCHFAWCVHNVYMRSRHLYGRGVVGLIPSAIGDAIDFSTKSLFEVQLEKGLVRNDKGKQEWGRFGEPTTTYLGSQQTPSDIQYIYLPSDAVLQRGFPTSLIWPVPGPFIPRRGDSGRTLIYGNI